MRFVDSNVLLYSVSTVTEEVGKAEVARQLMASHDVGLSVQVLQEFYVTVTQKLATGRASAREVIRTYTPWVQHPTTPETILRASEIAELSQLSFWDGLIVASAEQAGAAQLYTEDLNAGQTIVGVKIVNPLVAP